MKNYFPSIRILVFSLSIHVAALAAFAFGVTESRHAPVIKTPRYIQAKLVKLKNESAPVKSTKPVKIDLTKKVKKKEVVPAKNQMPVKKPVEKKPEPKKEVKNNKDEDEQKKQQEQLQQIAERMEKAMEDDLSVADNVSEHAAQSYVDAINQRITENWSRPPSARNGMQCQLLIQLVPTGRVVAVTLEKSSGNDAFDRSAIQAVKKVDTFPEIKDMPSGLFERDFRNLHLNFNPQDLRQ